MAGVLQSPSTPIAILPQHIAGTPTALGITQLSRWKRNYAITHAPTPTAEPQTLFSISSGGGFSKGFWNYSHDVTSSSGSPLFEIRRQWSRENFWLLRIPGQKGEEKVLARGGWKVSWNKLKLSFTIYNAAAGGEEVKLEVRGQDSSQIVFHVLAEEKVVIKVVRRGTFKSLEAPTWEVKVAEGFDLVLAAAIGVMIGDVVKPDSGKYLFIGAGAA